MRAALRRKAGKQARQACCRCIRDEVLAQWRDLGCITHETGLSVAVDAAGGVGVRPMLGEALEGILGDSCHTPVDGMNGEARPGFALDGVAGDARQEKLGRVSRDEAGEG